MLTLLFIIFCIVGFSIEGPSQAKIDCKDNGDGSADITYWPTAPGEYAVHILCNEEDIPKSPYMAEIIPAMPGVDATQVRYFIIYSKNNIERCYRHEYLYRADWCIVSNENIFRL